MGDEKYRRVQEKCRVKKEVEDGGDDREIREGRSRCN